MREDVVGDRARERIVRFGADVHLHDGVRRLRRAGIRAVHILDRGGDEVAAALAGAQYLGDAQQVSFLVPALDLSTAPTAWHSSSSPVAIFRLSSSGSVEPSNMCELNSGGSPRAWRARESSQ